MAGQSAPAPVTVIIPAYNAAAFLGSALDSVAAQTRPVGEVVVVDDGSTDDTAAIAAAAGARVIPHPKNRGLAATRNTGIRASRHEWIAFLDADDQWHREKTEKEFALLERVPDLELIFSEQQHFNEGGIVKERFLATWPAYRSLPREPLGGNAVRFEGEDVALALVAAHFLIPSSVLVRKALLERAGLYDEMFGDPHAGRLGAEDLDLNLRLVPLTRPAAIETPLVRYRLSENSMSRQDLRMILGAVRIMDKMDANPERYSPGAPEEYRLERPGKLRSAGLILMERGDFSGARALLRRSFQERKDPKTAVALAIALGGPVPHRVLRTLKRRLNLPGLG